MLFFFEKGGMRTAKRAKPEGSPRETDRWGADELNLAEFPLASLSDRVAPDQKTLRFEDRIFDEGQNREVHRRLEISGSDAYGLPRPVDSDVLLVLIRLAQLRGGFHSRELTFSRYELVKLLRWSICGKSFARLDQSLHRWAGVTLYYHRAWWDKTHRQWRSRSFHVLDAVDLRGSGGKTSAEDSLSSVTWNQVLFESFVAQNLKRLDLDLYFRLTRPAARQALRFLDKRFYRSRALEFELRNFACEHVGLGRNYSAAQLKRKLQAAIEELESVGFLEPLSYSDRYRKRAKGEWIVSLVRAGTRSSRAPKDIDPAATELLGELLRHGLRPSTARELISQFPASRIHEKTAFLDALLKSPNPPRNPPGFLTMAIRNDYQDSQRQRASVRNVTPRSKNATRLATPEACRLDLDDAALREFRNRWSALTAEEQREIEARAMARASRFQIERLRDLEARESSLAGELREHLLFEFLRANPQVSHLDGSSRDGVD